MNRIITFPTCKRVVYMGQLIEVPMWVKYLGIKPRIRGDKADLIGFSHKPYITARLANWRLQTNNVGGRKEVIGYMTHCDIKFDDSANVFKTLVKLPEE